MQDGYSLSDLLEKRAKLQKQLQSMAEVQKNIEAIDRVLKLMNYNPPPNGTETPTPRATLVIPERYHAALKWEEKIACILNAIKEGFAKDVAVEINRYEPTISITDAESAAKYYLSKMFREHKIIVVRKDGKKYKYGINQEEEMK
jgi:hypothetical protein